MKTILASSAFAALVASSPAAVLLESVDLGGSRQDTTIWSNLTSGNPTLAPDSGTGTLAVTAPGFPASFGIYSFSTGYAIDVAQALAYDLESIFFQVEIAANPDQPWPYSGGPVLTIDTGTESPVAFAAGASEVRGSFTYTAYAWQWDLSSHAGSITSLEIDLPLAVHSSVAAARLDAGDSFSPAIAPEPGTALLSLVGLGLAFRRQR